MSATSAGPAGDNTIVIRRDFDAPRDQLWDAWTKTDQIEQWFGPEGFTTRVEKNDLRIGGESRYVMVGPDGREYPSEGTFRDVVPGRRIVSTDEFGEDYKTENPDADLPTGMVVTLTFQDRGEGSTLEIQIDHPDAKSREKHEDMGVVAGWQSTLDCLQNFLATRQR